VNDKIQENRRFTMYEIFSGTTIQQWWREDSRAAFGQNVGGRLLRRGDTETCALIWQMSQFAWRLCREVA
jgi:hypothetical protein